MAYKGLSCGCMREVARRDPVSTFLWNPGLPEASEEFQHGGDGRGNYEGVDKYKYVGDGKKSNRDALWVGSCLRLIGCVMLGLMGTGAGLLMATTVKGDRWNGAQAIAGKVVASMEDALKHATRRDAPAQPAAAEGAAAAAVHVAPAMAVAVATGAEAIIDGPMYNCTLPPDQETWSPTKKAWCCKHEGQACPPFACSIGEQGMWPEEKAVWCCRNEALGCELLKPSEHAGISRLLSNPWEAWSSVSLPPALRR